MALVWRDVGESGGGWFDDGTTVATPPAPILPTSLNGVAVDANPTPTQGSGLWEKAGTYLAPNGGGVDATGALAVSGIDSPTLNALGFQSWAAANPDKVNGVYDASTTAYTPASDLFLKDAHLDLYSHPYGAPGAELQATQAVDSRTGTAVGPQAIVSTDTGDDLVGKIWLGMAAAFTAGTLLLADAGAGAVAGAAPELGGDALDASWLAPTAADAAPELASTATVDALGPAELSTFTASAGDAELADALTTAASSASPFTLPSLQQLGQGAGLAQSLVNLGKSIGILPTPTRPTSSPVPSSSSSSSTAAAQHRGLLIVGALVLAAVVLHKKGGAL